MQKQITLKLRPSEAANAAVIKEYIAAAAAVPLQQVTGFTILKQSIDARSRQAWINLSVQAYLGEPFRERLPASFTFKEVNRSPEKVIIIGAGPAGLFAALYLLEKGIKPVLLERGKDVRARRRDLALLNKEGIVNPESNYCFGEGGAGTYSDGKLYTRSNKRGDINRILSLLHHFGAGEEILYEAHPHIGTNKLPHIITAMRQQILDCGGEFLFQKKVTDFSFEKNKISGVQTADGDFIPGNAVVLATGHSARDIFILLQRRGLLIEPKPFALGVRIEHPQQLIDSIQYHCSVRDAFLPPAAYSLVQQVDGKGVFSFCMCPGGIIAPAATSPGELVVNGWSPSKRNNPYSNSGIVVNIEEKDWQRFSDKGPLAAMYFQQSVEEKAFQMGGGRLVAPAQRMTDFVNHKISASLPACSYLPGIHPVNLHNTLPGFVAESLRQAFIQFGKKMKGYLTHEAVVVATESRTSSPVRIPRHAATLTHPQVQNLYPCGEGAGYAGGIVSAAMDGERVAQQISAVLTG